MYDHNQLEVPDSFVALYLGPGGLKPGATREAVTARYELCEELANHLHDYARAQHHDAGWPTDEVLRRCHQGLLSGPSGLNEAEATWVVRRLAELNEWTCPALPEQAG